MTALIIYDDFHSLAKANTALRRSEQSADCFVQWDIKFWRMGMLKYPAIAEKARNEAMLAHLIVFAGCSAHAFPLWLQDWLEEWNKFKRIDDAVLAVVASSNAARLPSVASVDLNEFAEQHGLTIIFDDRRTIEYAARHFTESFLELGSPIFSIVPKVLDGKSRDGYRGWGINE